MPNILHVIPYSYLLYLTIKFIMDPKKPNLNQNDDQLNESIDDL